MAEELYKKPVLFAIIAAVVILTGTAVTMFIPMLTRQMHPRLENLQPFTPLQLAGRDIYQREGCNNCHTQTVRPLKAEVMRYGEYSKAGEFAYDYPFLWGSKRTGPDLARIGGKYPDAWHYRHFEDPRKFFPRSNMPSYGWLKGRQLSPEAARKHMMVLGFPFQDDDISILHEKDELDALVAYLQVIGTAVKKKEAAAVQQVSIPEAIENPLAGDPEAIALGKELFEENCADCHGERGEGDIGPSFVDNLFLNVEGDVSDAVYFQVVHNGLDEGMMVEGREAEGGMPDFGEALSTNEIWSVITFIRSLQGG